MSSDTASFALTQTEWHGQPAWTLENEGLRVVTVPGMGAKIVSLFDKRARHEWLLPPDGRPFQPVPYGAVFTDQDMSGWDEMFPSIDACPYPAADFAGTPVPDHGEVWALPWGVEETGNAHLNLAVQGEALPYHLHRSMALPDAHTLHLAYEVVNTGDAPVAYLWAAHPQFCVGPDTEIQLPPDVRRVLSVQATDAWAAETTYSWPHATSRRGDAARLDRVAPLPVRAYRKIYTLPDEPVSWAALHNADAGCWLRMAWNPADLPYLGVWVDEGRIDTRPTVALEPSNGFYDSLDRAWRNHRTPILAPGERHTWSLTVRVGTAQ